MKFNKGSKSTILVLGVGFLILGYELFKQQNLKFSILSIIIGITLVLFYEVIQENQINDIIDQFTG